MGASGFSFNIWHPDSNFGYELRVELVNGRTRGEYHRRSARREHLAGNAGF